MEILRTEGVFGLPRRGALRMLSGVSHSTGKWAYHLERNLGGHRREDLVELRKNRELRDRHRGKRCFVIGNGPTLATQDLSPLGGDVTLVMNSFWKHPALERWQPTYYCIADPIYFDGSEPMRRWFSEIGEHVRSTTYLVPLFGREVIASQGLLPLEHTRFVSFRGRLEDGLGTPDLTAAVPEVQSVSQLAVLAAMYMGCSPIYLLGMDHDWLAQRGMDRHFYPGHPVPGHVKAHGDLDQCYYADDLVAALKLWRGYEQLQGAAARSGIEIFNATNGGFLDVFPRVSYESLI